MSRVLKPLPGTPLNYAHPLCPLNSPAGTGGLLLPLNEGSGSPRLYLATKTAAPTSALTERLGTFTNSAFNSTPRSQWGGPTVVHTTTGGFLNLGTASDFLGTDTVTIVLGYKKIDTAGFRWLFNISSNTDGHMCHAALDGGTGQIFFYFGGQVAGTSRIDSPTGLTFGDDVWVFTAGDRGMEIWQNGWLVKSQTGHATRLGNTNAMYLGADAFWGSSDLGHHAFFYVYDRQMTRDEVSAISLAPFCFYDWGEDEPKGPTTQTQSLAGTLTTAGAMSTGTLHKRLYFDSAAAAAAAPTFDAGWSTTTGADRKRLNHVKQSSAITAGAIVSWATTAGTKQLNRQYISAPLSGAQTISGTVKMQLAVREEDNRCNVDQLWLAVKVVSIDGGTVRGTLLAHGNYGPTTEFEFHTGPGGAGFPPLYQNKKGADGDAITLVNALDGDRILVEIGYSNSTAGVANPAARALWGDTNTDLPEDETTGGLTEAAGQPGWIEFSTSLLFREATTQSLGGGATPAGNVLKLVGKIL